MEKIHFWNGNKSCARQEFELALLDACLRITEKQYGLYTLLADDTNYPEPEDEGNIFDSPCDLLVTVAGNVKFENKQKIVIKQPLAKGLLGHRLLIVRNESLEMFQSLRTLEALQTLAIGIPATWADAELFRQNHFKVVEGGTLDDIFLRLQHKEFDFIALGANEIETIFAQQVAPLKGMSIETSIMLYYPFPLVFYVHPDKFLLAQRVESGLSMLRQTGEYERLFRTHHGDVVLRLNLSGRKVFSLDNPALPEDMKKVSASLLD